MPAKKDNSPAQKPEAPGKKAKPAGQTPESKFIDTVFGFFSGVLKAIAADDLLRVLWGVEVLLFSILALMVFFGNISADQRFFFALIIVASVVAMFLVTNWRTSHRPAAQPTTETVEQAQQRSDADDGHAHPPPSVVDPTLVKHAQKGLALLIEIEGANARILRRGGSGAGPWARLLSDTYNNVCRVRHERRLKTQPPDAYFDAICAEPDLETVCDRKWDLGEILEDYRKQLNRNASMPADHDALELLIRRSVTQPDCSPSELGSALLRSIESAKGVVLSSKP